MHSATGIKSYSHPSTLPKDSQGAPLSLMSRFRAAVRKVSVTNTLSRAQDNDDTTPWDGIEEPSVVQIRSERV